MKCKYGKLKKPVREFGKIRHCKLNPNRKINRKVKTKSYGSMRYARMRRLKE